MQVYFYIPYAKIFFHALLVKIVVREIIPGPFFLDNNLNILQIKQLQYVIPTNLRPEKPRTRCHNGHQYSRYHLLDLYVAPGRLKIQGFSDIV